jgi:hypothetical protein
VTCQCSQVHDISLAPGGSDRDVRMIGTLVPATRPANLPKIKTGPIMGRRSHFIQSGIGAILSSK